ncbi:hypothetical protein RB595_010754 [Gaeumannomyces hyphopodioides]
MADEIARLREAIAQAQRQTEEIKRQIEEEKRRREEVVRVTQPQTLGGYLETSHSLSLAIQVVTDRPLTTQSDTTNSVGRIYPQQIAKWHDFPARQEEIWEQLSDPSFADNPVFPSELQMDYVKSSISPISSERSLRIFEYDTVEKAAQKLVNAVFQSPQLRNSLGLRGAATFESQFCIYRTEDGARIPTMAIEYKAPHKLNQDEIVTGLASKIQPERDVINKGRESFALASRALAAAIVTQLFSYMVGKGLQYGYVCTGQVFVFLYIPDDPATVLYHVCVPNLDVVKDDENRLHRTAVAQVFAFILQSLRAPQPPQSWKDAAQRLKTWDEEFEDVLSKIPETVRKDTARASPYKAQRWCGFTRSPIRTRSPCNPSNVKSDTRHKDDDKQPPPPPTPGRSTRSGRNLATSSASSAGAAATSGASSGKGRGGGRRPDIRDRAYCTHQCLAGLALGGPMDPSCPNAPSHGPKHIRRVDFLRLVREQLAHDRGRDADAVPLYRAGAVGSLFKVRLSAHGYTLVAKGVESAYHDRLRHEETIYNQLSTIQGRHVPVCLGLIDLVLPWYCDDLVCEHFLLLSWAGLPLFKCVDRVDKMVAVDAITKAFTELHRLGVYHSDAKVRNFVYDRNIMVVDFERAEVLGPNGQNRKRKRGLPQNQGKDPFAEELRLAVEDISQCFGQC